ncbi:ArsR/SmtB family transcription factor [Roseococcus pinisoli]|uniref:Winged helix-turn-helix transcriptional regulator n=1 Tax=Roseococcus pinisoli TaxID=2835040 RepID=A0ABS5QB29_9PROT|nr:metalloregulator ArsR/SmtB family transcription factor [Roseococcus pinisoli]MBS7810901.1 winged helix-turn-helix transcriptional regulator [Roseococcus pinisoli]
MSNLATIAHLIGDPSRAAMLQALLPGEALTAGELARVAGIGAAATSGQLKALVESGLVSVHAQGRHRYHRLAGEEVAAALETLIALPQTSPRRSWPHGDAFRQARLCWHHLAGRLGVALYDSLTTDRWIEAAPGGWVATEMGEARLGKLGVDLVEARRATRFACDCMDWSERRPHLAGGLGREITSMLTRRHWLRRIEPSSSDTLLRRRLTCTPEGARALSSEFGITA